MTALQGWMVIGHNDVAIATYLRNGFKSTQFEILVAPFASFAAER